MLLADMPPRCLPGAGGDDNRPLVSVVVLSCNRRRELQETLEQLRGLPYRPREVIVVDNGSSDGSAEMVRRVFPETRLMALPRNVGIEGLNVGLRAAQGEVIVLLDDDSYPLPEALSQLVTAFGRDATLGIAACRIDGPPGWWEAKWPWENEASGTEVPTFIGCGVGLRRTAVRRAGYFDGAFFLYENELDLAARVVNAGYTVRYFPQIRFVHAVSAVNRTNLREDYYGLRNLLWILWKYFPGREATHLSVRAAGERIGYCLLHRDLRRAWVAASAVWAAVTGRRATLRRQVLSADARKRLLVYINHWYPPVWRWLGSRLRPSTAAGSPGHSERLLFVGFGDVERSLGARAYFLALLEAWRRGGGVARGIFLQQAVGHGVRREDYGTLAIVRPPIRAPKPAVLWRPYELAWALWQGYRLLGAGCDRATVCILAGAALLPLARVFRGRYARLIYVLHGVAEEFLLVRGLAARLKYGMTKALERAFLPACDAVIVVSARMGEYCRAEYGVTKTLVVPCGVRLEEFRVSEEDRAETRRALNLQDRFVFVYSGGAAPWQCVRETVECYRLAQTLIANAFLLVLSPDADAWAAALRDADPGTYRIANVPHTEVGRYLCGADAAFLLRKRTPVNFVSAPVKFAEYMACGLPVVTSPYVGDYSAMVQDRSLGVCLDPADRSTWDAAIHALRTLASDPQTRIRCRRTAEDLSWEMIAPRVRSALDGAGDLARESIAALSR